MASMALAPGLATGLALALTGSARAQAQGAQPVGLRIVPFFDTSVSYVDSNYALLPPGARADLVTTVRPGVQMSTRRGRMQASLSYALSAIHHSRQGQGNSLQNDLAATLSAELVERWIFLDASASIAQQAISTYGLQSADNTQVNSNRTEISQLSVKPYSRGNLGGVAVYDVALNLDLTHARSAAVPDSRSAGASVSLGSVSSGAVFGWRASLGQQRSSFSGGQSSDNTRGSVSLLVRPNAELSGSLRGGQENTKIGAFYDRSTSNYGGDLQWLPSPRTSASVSADHRYFGEGYALSLNHRLSRASFRFTSTRDVNNGTNGSGVGQRVTLYQLFFAQFESLQPDPVLREQLVRDFLASLGQDPNAVVSGGYVNNGITVQRRDDLSMSYTHVRTTFTLQGFRSQSRSLDTGVGTFIGVDVDQYGFVSSLSYRLTPSATTSLSASRLVTQGRGTQPGNRLSSLSLSWSDRVSRLVTASANMRYSVFDNPTNPYREIALGATLSLHF